MKMNKCRYCGKVIMEGSLFCNDDCEEDYGKATNDAQIDQMIDLKDEAIRLMVREEPCFIRNTEPQDNEPSGAVKSE